MIRDSVPTRTLSDRPDLDQLKRQAKELLEAFRVGDRDAVAEVTAHYRSADSATFALHDAQLVIARAYGFESWPKLKAFVEGATVRRFIEAVRARDLLQVRAMLQARPELSGSGLHVAVVEREPELVRLLMQHGANARVGIYPHRDATSPLTIATERGYDELVTIIREEERNRQQAKSGVAAPADELFEAIRSGNDERAVTLLESEPALIRAAQNVLDAAAYQVGLWGENADHVERFGTVADLLLKHGAELTPRAAVALGRIEWLRARHAEGALTNRTDHAGGLLRVAVSHNRPEILSLLLGFGFDPDERTRFRDVGVDEVVFTWGMPLWHCAASRKYEMANILLSHGADPNGEVYASGTPVSEAFGQADSKMIALLEQHGGVVEPWVAAQHRQTDRVIKMMTDASDTRAMAETLLSAAACGGSPEIVRLALEHVDWARDDLRWFSILEQPLRIWHHSRRHWARPDWDRETYQTCFRMILERCDPNVRGRNADGSAFGLTILHSVAGSRDHVTAEERVAFATMLLDAGAGLELRDDILRSTPLGWACRWGRVELVRLYLDRGADPVEADAEPWATPLAWAQKKGHRAVIDLLRSAIR